MDQTKALDSERLKFSLQTGKQTKQTNKPFGPAAFSTI
jgi:hypothetical protein